MLPIYLEVTLESYEVVEWFQRIWPTVAKNTVLTDQSGSLLAVFFRVGVLGYVDLQVGPRGGIKETVIVIDPTQEVVADRLLVLSTDGDSAGRGLLVSIDNLRSKVYRAPLNRRRATALYLCSEALDAFVRQIAQSAIHEGELRNLPSTSTSIIGVYSGGLPGHGPDRGTRR